MSYHQLGMLHPNLLDSAYDCSGFRFKLLFSMCEDKDSRKRTTRASILAANRAASSSSESEEVSHTLYTSCSSPVGMDCQASCQLFINDVSRMQFHCRCRITFLAGTPYMSTEKGRSVMLLLNSVLIYRVQSFAFNKQEEEQAVKPRNAKRRRKANTTVESDSDE